MTPDNGNASFEVETQFLTDLKRFCLLARRSKARPELAIYAATWEMRVDQRLEEIERLTHAAGNGHTSAPEPEPANP